MDYSILEKYIPIKSKNELIDFFVNSIKVRNEYKNDSAQIARYVFDMTNQSNIPFKMTDELLNIRFEFGALEAPGSPEDVDISFDEYDDKLWKRLLEMVLAIKMDSL